MLVGDLQSSLRALTRRCVLKKYGHCSEGLRPVTDLFANEGDSRIPLAQLKPLIFLKALIF